MNWNNVLFSLALFAFCALIVYWIIRDPSDITDANNTDFVKEMFINDRIVGDYVLHNPKGFSAEDKAAFTEPKSDALPIYYVGTGGTATHMKDSAVIEGTTGVHVGGSDTGNSSTVSNYKSLESIIQGPTRNGPVFIGGGGGKSDSLTRCGSGESISGESTAGVYPAFIVDRNNRMTMNPVTGGGNWFGNQLVTLSFEPIADVPGLSELRVNASLSFFDLSTLSKYEFMCDLSQGDSNLKLINAWLTCIDNLHGLGYLPIDQLSAKAHFKCSGNFYELGNVIVTKYQPYIDRVKVTMSYSSITVKKA